MGFKKKGGESGEMRGSRQMGNVTLWHLSRPELWHRKPYSTLHTSPLYICGDVKHLPVSRSFSKPSPSSGQLLFCVCGSLRSVAKPRSGYEIDLNECCGQLIAVKDFLLSFPREFLLWCWLIVGTPLKLALILCCEVKCLNASSLCFGYLI